MATTTIRDELDAAERSVKWAAWPNKQTYGPGLTAYEVAERHNRFLRSGWSGWSSHVSYHNVRVAPLGEPPDPWREHYPSWVVGKDPWTI